MAEFKKETDPDWGKKLVDLDVLEGLEQANMALGAVVGLLCGEDSLEGVGGNEFYCLLGMIHREFDKNLRKIDA